MIPGFPLDLTIPCLLLLGALFIMFVYHLLLYRQYREKIILKYSFYLLAMFLYLIADINSRSAGNIEHSSAMLITDSFNFIAILVYATFIIGSIPYAKQRYKRLYIVWNVSAIIIA
jgi:hypothetical protein